eukprot:7440492-Pyramimonas_sp.AAC.1
MLGRNSVAQCPKCCACGRAWTTPRSRGGSVLGAEMPPDTEGMSYPCCVAAGRAPDPRELATGEDGHRSEAEEH